MKSILLVFMIFTVAVLASCNKQDDFVPDTTTNTITIDSLIPTKRNLVVWEECYITVYARGENLTYKWETDHGSIFATNTPITKMYYACPSCLGNNTIKCTVSNENGSVSDTVMVHISGK